MNRVMLLYPPGKLYQRGEDRAQCNIEDSTASSVHACNDLGYAAAILRARGYEVFLRDYQTERKAFSDVERDHGVHIRIQKRAVTDHRKRASPALLIGLENELDRAPEFRTALKEERRRAERHGRMRVVPAGMHASIVRSER